MNKFTLPREAYLSRDVAWTRCGFESAGLDLFRYETERGYFALGFFGKAQKPAFHYRFKSEEQRATFIKEQVAAGERTQQHRAGRAAQRKAFVPSLAVGDILRESWGYDQTNINYYEVVSVSGKRVTVREIAQTSQETGYMSGRCSPKPGDYIGPPSVHLVQQGNAIKVRDWGSYAYPCKPTDSSYWSSYA
jgi:hypothetical protein